MAVPLGDDRFRTSAPYRVTHGSAGGLARSRFTDRARRGSGTPLLSETTAGHLIQRSRYFVPAPAARRTGLIAEIGTGAPVIGLRADIDALPLRKASGLPFAPSVPGAVHAWGHDVHTAVPIGTALVLQEATAQGQLTGTVRLICQPAEDVMPESAGEVIAAGGLAGVDQAFALHCEPKAEAGTVGLKVGPITSTSDLVELHVTGPGGHTSRPHLTADVVNALGLVITGLSLMISRRLDPWAAPVMVWGAVEAGRASNAVPLEGRLRGTLRLMRREARDGAEAVVQEIVAGLLAPTGVTYELTVRRGVPPVENEA